MYLILNIKSYFMFNILDYKLKMFDLRMKIVGVPPPGSTVFLLSASLSVFVWENPKNVSDRIYALLPRTDIHITTNSYREEYGPS